MKYEDAISSWDRETETNNWVNHSQLKEYVDEMKRFERKPKYGWEVMPDGTIQRAGQPQMPELLPLPEKPEEPFRPIQEIILRSISVLGVTTLVFFSLKNIHRKKD